MNSISAVISTVLQCDSLLHNTLSISWGMLSIIIMPEKSIVTFTSPYYMQEEEPSDKDTSKCISYALPSTSSS